MPSRAVAALAAAAVLVAGCGDGGTATPTDAPPSPLDTTPSPTATTTEPASPTATPEDTPAAGIDDVRLGLEVVAEGLDSPVFVTSRPDDDRLFVLEQPGRVQAVSADGTAVLVLDLTDRVDDGGNEQGLLGMAFHPDEPDRFYLDYTHVDGATHVEEYRLRPDGTAGPEPQATLLTVDQPASNHNGGMLAFDPGGGLLVALGDGGGGGDQFGNGQDLSTLLGTITRLDPDGQAAPEVAHYGLRNPWRFSLDTEGGQLYVADVGQNAWEEVTVVPLDADRLNLGWPITEGTACFDPPEGCDTGGLTLPQVTYPLGEGGTCAIIGGRVYRGSAIAGLEGHYLYADHCAGFLRSFRFDPSAGGSVAEQRDWTEQLGTIDGVTSFGLGPDGELYLTQRGGGGRVLRVVSAG